MWPKVSYMLALSKNFGEIAALSATLAKLNGSSRWTLKNFGTLGKQAEGNGNWADV